MYNVIKKKLAWSRYFLGDSQLSGFIRSYKVFTLHSGGRYFRRVVTIGTLRYLQEFERQGNVTAYVNTAK